MQSMEIFVNNSMFDNCFIASSLMDYFVQSNFAGQVIIIILLILSVMAWGVMFCKQADLKAIETQNLRAAKCIKNSTSLIQAASSVKSISSPYSVLFKEALNTLTYMGLGKQNTAVRTAMVENALTRELSHQIAIYEERMTLLGTIISGAPFLGLLGTAWGVMDCFGSMGGQTSVTLQQLAPGVSGALLTTVAGLVVAIPSVFGYNFLSTKIKKMTVDTENFAASLSDRIQMEAIADASPSVATRESKQPIFVEKVVSAPSDTTKIIDFSLDDDSDEITNFDE